MSQLRDFGTDSHRTISKNSSGCRLLIGHKKCFVLLCPIGEQFLLSSFREFVHDGYCLAAPVHQACACKGNFNLFSTFLPRIEGTTDESKKRLGCYQQKKVNWPLFILGDPGAVSRVWRKGATKVFKYGRKGPWVPTLTELFPKIQAHTGSRLGTKTALYYCAQSANSFSWVLFVSSYTTAIVLPHLPGSFTKLVRARKAFIFFDNVS